MARLLQHRFLSSRTTLNTSKRTIADRQEETLTLIAMSDEISLPKAWPKPRLLQCERTSRSPLALSVTRYQLRKQPNSQVKQEALVHRLMPHESDHLSQSSLRLGAASRVHVHQMNGTISRVLEITFLFLAVSSVKVLPNPATPRCIPSACWHGESLRVDMIRS
jgi:hypothetical protein